MQSAAEQFDVVIVGSGIAGSALAVALAGTDLRVAVIEAQPAAVKPRLDENINAYDLRVSALTAASQRFLDRLKVWPLILQQRACAYRQMQVWDGEGTGAVGFDASDVFQPALGHIVENRVLVWALMQRLRLAANVVFLNPVRVESMRALPQGGYLLELDQGLSVQTSLVVGADGALSRIREWAGFRTREWDYGHHALVATVATERPHQHTAWQRFMSSGPLAFLPLPDAEAHQRYCSIVWSTSPADAARLQAQEPELFCAELGRAFEYRLGAVTAVSDRQVFPLRQRHAVDYVQPGIALVADAAHTIHPLAGQGINLGLLDVQALAEELLKAHRRGVCLGSVETLGRYQRRRKAHNLGMMAVMEGFKQLFGEPALPVRWLRNEGMNRLQRLPWVKRQIIRQAMGL